MSKDTTQKMIFYERRWKCTEPTCDFDKMTTVASKSGVKPLRPLKQVAEDEYDSNIEAQAHKKLGHEVEVIDRSYKGEI